MQHRIELAFRQHTLDRLVVGEAADLQARRRRELDRLVELGEPFDRAWRHPVFVLEDAAHPDAGGRLELLDPDPPPDQVLGLPDALAGIDEHEAVAETPMQEDRNGAGDETLVARHDERGT